MRDREFLQWIHDRLVAEHNEDPLFDYMHNLRSIIKATEYSQVTPNVCSSPKENVVSKIDWSKPLECNNGDLTLVAYDGDKAEVDLAGCMTYWVYMSDGEYVGSVLDGEFTVRNKKTSRDSAMGMAKHFAGDDQAVEESLVFFVEKLNEAGLIKE